MKYYIIAGERSGDLHGANLIKNLLEKDANAMIRCWGGDMMEAAGGDLVVHYKEIAFMGILEVLKNYQKIKRFLSKCKNDIANWNPDVVIFIDYPGFNMRVAKYAKKSGFRTYYYISPKIWAWNQKRIFKIKERIDKMFCILPFEKEFYARFNYQVDYVGNPLTDSIKSYEYDQALINEWKKEKKLKIAILPGSRIQEIQNMLGLMSELFVKFPNVQFFVAGVDNLSKELYKKYIDEPNVQLYVNKAYDILRLADGAIVTSGTATLETALFNVPQIVCYRTSRLTYTVGKALVKVKYISLVNLILDKLAVKELIQNDFNLNNLSKFVNLIENADYSIEQIRNDYKELSAIIGDQNTSEKTASTIFKYLTS